MELMDFNAESSTFNSSFNISQELLLECDVIRYIISFTFEVCPFFLYLYIKYIVGSVKGNIEHCANYFRGKNKFIVFND